MLGLWLDATETTACPIGHMTYTQIPVGCGEKPSLLISFHSASEKLLNIKC